MGMASIPWDMSKGNLDHLYLRTNSLRGVLPHELPPLSGPESGKSGPFFVRAGPSRAHERHEFPREWLPSLGTCPKATWMASICKPTAYGASLLMNSRPSLGLKAANLGRFSYAQGHQETMRGMNLHGNGFHPLGHVQRQLGSPLFAIQWPTVRPSP